MRRVWVLLGCIVLLSSFSGLRAGEASDEETATFIKKGPKPPARVGERVPIPFPPPPGVRPTAPKPQQKREALSVILHQPEGSEQFAHTISVSFNQPMVPVSSLGEIKKGAPPLIIEPAIPGTFRWAGTQTIAFEPKGRIPFATGYKVTVPGGVKSAFGDALKETFVFFFQTPVPAVTSVQPYNGSTELGLDPAIILGFNQAVSTGKNLPFVTLNDGAGNAVPLKAILREAWQKETRVQYLSGQANPERLLVFVPEGALKPNTGYTVKVLPGFVSDEGPLPLPKPFSSAFSTYSPLKVQELVCSSAEYNDDYTKKCPVGGEIVLEFNHGLVVKEPEKFVSVTPRPANFKLLVEGSVVRLSGAYQAETSYRVGVRPGIEDEHKQVLQQPWSGTMPFVHLPPQFQVLVDNITVLERGGAMKLPLSLQNVEAFTASVYRLPDAELFSVLDFSQHLYDHETVQRELTRLKPLLVSSWQEQPRLPRDRAEVYGLPLQPVVAKSGPGPYLVVLRGPRGSSEDQAWQAALVQVTDLGLSVRYDNERMVVLATSVTSGKPLPGVQLRLFTAPKQELASGATGKDGTAVLRAGAPKVQSSFLLLVASTGNDRSFVHLSSQGDDQRYLSFNWGNPGRQAVVSTFLFPDRDLFRPGEEVHVFGIARQFDAGPFGLLGLLPDAARSVHFQVQSSRSREIAKGTAPVSFLGVFQFSFKLPEDVDLGWFVVRTGFPPEAGLLGGEGNLSLQAQEYRAPEFEVNVEVSPQPLFFKDKLHATIRGDYLFGAPMRGGEVSWALYSQEAKFSPPNHAEFHFGEAERPWYRLIEEMPYRYREIRNQLLGGSGKLDDQGRLLLEAPLPAFSQIDPLALTLEAQVFDVNRQAVAGRSTLLAHPADRYLGVHLEKYLVEAGEPSRAQFVLVDLDGQRMTGTPIQVKVSHAVEELVPTKDEQGHATTEYRNREVEVATCKLISSSAPVECALVIPEGGTYTLEATARDSQERPVVTRTFIEAIGKAALVRETQAKALELIPDRRVYQPGQAATVLVRAPFEKGVVLLTEERAGLLDHHLLNLDKGTVRVSFPVRSEYIPNLTLSATAVRAREPGKGGKRPPAAWANGMVSLEISRDVKKLVVSVRPASETAGPGEKVPVEVRVVDDAKRPVKAAVALSVVDEAVLSMSGFSTPDPLPIFFFSREPGVILSETLRMLLPEEVKPRKKGSRAAPAGEEAADIASGPMLEREAVPKMSARKMSASKGAGHAGAGPGKEPLVVRKVFATTAAATVISTDEKGKASFTLPLPDNLTRFRLMAVAADGKDRFGSAEARLTVKKTLQVRPALPRFANTGDVFSAGVVIDNQTGDKGKAEVSLAVSGATLLDPPARSVEVAPGTAVETAFQVKAERPGLASFQFAVRLGGQSDAVQNTLPVWVPATTEAFATYGTTTGSVAQPVKAPDDALPGFGALQVTLSATALTGLQDAITYLFEYPYECAEQTASRALPIIALGKILEAFQIGGSGGVELQRDLARNAVRRLVAGQRSDGGWGSWWASEVSRADLTAYVLFILKRGQEAGFAVPADTLGRARSFLISWMSQNQSMNPSENKGPWWRRYLLDTTAQVLFVLTEDGSRFEEPSRTLFAARGELDLFAQAMLAAVFHRANPQGTECKLLFRELGNRVVETPGTVRFVEELNEALRLLMHSSSRTDAIALLAFLEVDPKNELIPKIVRGLMDARINGRWETTQANAWALVALARYFSLYEAEPTEFTASLWLGNGYLGATTFGKKTMRESELDVPLKVVRQASPADLVIGKEGTGRLYYRVGMRYAPKDFTLPPLEQGFTVQRSYEAVEKPEDVSKDAQGNWVVKAGSYVRVHLLVVVPDRRYYVVVDDPLPAGLELVNMAYRTSAREQLAEEGDAGWAGYWISWMFNHRELRDERSLDFADELWPGVYHLAAVARATTRGDFLVPPARAEEMYRPEVFGRSATDRLSVK